MAAAKKGIGSIFQTEHFHAITSEKMKLPVMKRVHLKGTNKGDCMQDVPVLSVENLWMLPKAAKTELLDKYVIRCGGKEGSDDESSSEDDQQVSQWFAYFCFGRLTQPAGRSEPPSSLHILENN